MLKGHLLMAKFVGHEPAPQDLVTRLQTLNLELRGSMFTMCRNVGKGYFLLAIIEKKHRIMS